VNGILQISAIIEIDGKVVETFDRYVQPLPSDEINDDTLKFLGYTREQIESFEPVQKVQQDFLATLKKYVNPFDKTDYFTMVVYNEPFDHNFIVEWFRKNREEEDCVYNFIDEAMSGGLRTANIFEFLEAWYKKTGFVYFASYVNKRIDVYALLVYYYHLRGEYNKRIRLVDVAKDFSVEIEAHNAMSDISATREIFLKMYSKLIMGNTSEYSK
jgi:DNA polymerase III epsilon subunit-like protein